MNIPDLKDRGENWIRLESRNKTPLSAIRLIHLDWIKSIVVAIILIFIVGGSAILSGRNEQKAVDWVYVNSVTGQEQVNLPDGSRIQLRKGSTIAYPSNFGSHHREIQLKGEAYFEVLYSSSVPFSVKARNEFITETGTSFLIRSNDSIEQVIVSEGSVRFKLNNQKDEYVIVHAGETAEVKGNKLKLTDTDGENYLAWRNQQLIFNETLLQQVAADIQNFYGVPVLIDPAVAAGEIRVTAEFHNQQLPVILKELGEKTGLMISQDEKGVFIRKEMAAAVTVERKSPPTVPVKKKKPWWMFWR